MTLFLLCFLAACTSEPSTSKPTEEDRSYEETEEESCVNTFQVDVMPEQQVTEYGAELMSREDLLPKFLSETVLYSDILTKEIHPAVEEYVPRFQFWSDGAGKRRWAYIPECEKIDTSNVNDWSFPVGSRFFKEFSIDGQLIETRIIQKIGSGPRDFAYASYLWNEDEDGSRESWSGGAQVGQEYRA